MLIYSNHYSVRMNPFFNPTNMSFGYGPKQQTTQNSVFVFNNNNSNIPLLSFSTNSERKISFTYTEAYRINRDANLEADQGCEIRGVTEWSAVAQW